MKLCGVVILYHPDEGLATRIVTYLNAVNHLYVIDNGPKDNGHLLKSLISSSPLSYLFTGENEGISKRLNEASRLALAAGYEWLLTMDQDSYFDDASLQQYLSCVYRHPNKDKTAMFGIEHDESLLKKGEDCHAVETTHLITSGSLVNLHIWKELNGFDEALFIDTVDHEYCFRSLEKGYSIIKFETLLLHHAIGNLSQHRSLKNLKTSNRALHSPVRIYYMTRNYLYLQKKYPSNFSDEKKLFRKNLFIRYKNNLLYNKNRWQVLKYIIKAFRDYQQNRMGKIKN